MATIFMEQTETGTEEGWVLQDAATTSTTITAGTWSNYSWGSLTGNDTWAQWSASAGTFYGQYRIYHPGITSAGEYIRFRSPNGTTNVNFGVSAGRKMTIYRNGTLLGTSTTTTFADARWYYVQFKIVISDTAGEVVLKVDGVTESITWVTGTDTTQDTRADAAAGGDTCNQFGFDSGVGNNVYFDDVIINDTTGTDNTSYPDNLGIEALMPNAHGDNTALIPYGTASPTRYYFTNPFEIPATVSPTVSSGWEKTVDWGNSGTPRGQLTPTRRGSTFTNFLDSGDSWTTNDDVLLAQFVGPPLAAQTLSPASAWTFKCYAQAREANTGYDLASQIIIRVVSEDGTTERATLYSGQTETTDPPTSEWSTTATNRGFPRAGLLPATLTEYACAEGDRIVVELGFRAHSIDSTPTSSNYVRIGDPTTGTELPEDESTTISTSVPWFQFSTAPTISTRFNWEMVDERPPNDATDYVYDSVVDDYDIYNLPATQWTTVAAVALALRCQKSDAGAANIAHMLKIDTDASGSADELDTGSDVALSTSWTYHTAYYNRQPDNAGATSWTPAKVNALQAGAKVR